MARNGGKTVAVLLLIVPVLIKQSIKCFCCVGGSPASTPYKLAPCMYITRSIPSWNRKDDDLRGNLGNGAYMSSQISWKIETWLPKFPFTNHHMFSTLQAHSESKTWPSRWSHNNEYMRHSCMRNATKRIHVIIDHYIKMLWLSIDQNQSRVERAPACFRERIATSRRWSISVGVKRKRTHDIYK